MIVDVVAKKIVEGLQVHCENVSHYVTTGLNSPMVFGQLVDVLQTDCACLAFGCGTVFLVVLYYVL